MPLFYVTGVSGTGKSAMLEELRKRGYEAYGVDEDVYAKWIDRKSGKVAEFPGEENFEIHEWYKKHKWVLDVDKVALLSRDTTESGRTVFLCGAGAEDEAAWQYFSKIFALIIDVDTLKHRLINRTTNDFGKTDTEFQEVLKWHKGFEERHHKRGSVLVDATKSLDRVVNQILSHSRGS